MQGSAAQRAPATLSDSTDSSNMIDQTPVVLHSHAGAQATADGKQDIEFENEEIQKRNASVAQDTDYKSEEVHAQEDEPFAQFALLSDEKSDAQSVESAEDEDDLNTIKAKTMFKMVEELPDHLHKSRKLLFLSAKQAELISSSSESIEKMLSIGFEVPTPKLVINLLPSVFMTETGNQLRDVDVRASSDALDRFMLETLIPLAAQTHAIILCSASSGHLHMSCGLASSLTRTMSLMRSRWGHKPPFTIISCYDSPGNLYFNSNPAAAWRDIRSASRKWKQREPKLQELLMKHVAQQRADNLNWKPALTDDLDPSGENFLLVDSSSETKLFPPNSKRPYNALVTNIFKHLASTLPSLVLKTGCAHVVALHAASLSGLQTAVDSANAGSPLLLLDCSERPLPEWLRQPSSTGRMPPPGESPDTLLVEWAKDRARQRRQDGAGNARDSSQSNEVAQLGEGEHGPRAEMIHWAKQQMNCEVEEKGSVAAGLYTTMNLAWWISILVGNGDPRAVPSVRQQRARLEELYQVIARRQRGEDETAMRTGGVLAATEKQRSEAMGWMCWEGMKAEWEVLQRCYDSESPRQTWEEYKEAERDDMEKRSAAWVLRTNGLFRSKCLHAVNIRATRPDDVTQLVSGLVRLDRLPPENSVEGLLLLKQAWDEVDIAQHLAGRYKLVTKLLFAMHLALAFSIVSLASLSSDLELQLPRDGIKEAVFYLTVGSTFLISFDSFLNAKAKWRQLRYFGGALVSIAWQYRTRVEPFDPDRTNPDNDRPELRLGEALVAWRREMLAGAELEVSALGRSYPSRIFKHGQRPDGSTMADGAHHDDHFSPVQADEYVTLRLTPMVAWFQRRIPRATRQRLLLKLAMLLVTAASSVLARRALGPGVAILTAATSVITSWMEFSDTGHKLERYNRVVASLKNLLTWWERIGPVERASTQNISHLVHTGEMILSQERQAWQATSGKQGSEELEGGDSGSNLNRPRQALAGSSGPREGTAGIGPTNRVHPQ